MNSLGERIAYYRKKIQLTQEELAEKCSVTPQAVSKWENDLSAPDISLLPVLCDLFGITCDELLGRHKEETSSVAPELVDINKMLLRIKVLSSDGDKLNMNIPLSLGEVILKSGIITTGSASELLSRIDMNQILEMVKCGTVGKLVSVESSDGDIVEIWVE